MARQIVVDVIGDASKFNKTLDKAGGKTGIFGSKFAKTAKVFAIGAAAIGGAAVVVGVKVNEMGAQYEAMDAKAQTVFGDSLGTVKKWADANAAAMGLTKREATGLATGFADLLIPMGFTRDEAAAMSTDVVGLSGALSEWSGGQKTAAEVSDILAKAMLGEREGLKSLGISITENDVKQQLLKDGTSELTGAALEQAKAQATQTLIMAKSTDAQAAYEAGTAKGIRRQNEMKAKLNEVKETLVKALYPILQTVTKFIADNLPAAIKTAGDVWNWLSKNVLPTAVNIFKVVVQAVKVMAPVFRQVFHTIGDVITGFVRAIQAVVGAVQAVATRVQSIFRGMASIVGGIWKGLTGVIRGVFNTIIGIVNGVIGAINSIQVHIDVGPVSYHFNGLNLPRIPYMHAGGIVPGTPGSDVPAILQAGERVIPRSQAGGEVTINFNGPVYGDGIDELADRLAMRLRLQGVT